MRNRVRKLFVVGINLLVFLVLLSSIELYYRIWPPNVLADPSPNRLWQKFRAHVTLTVAPGTYDRWFNTFTKQSFPADIVTNSLGFNDRREFEYSKPYVRAANERIVLFTSASAGWGIGSTSDETTVAGQMQHYLNALQKERKYTVINLSMVGWIAFQEFVGLELWGDAFGPDWIVVMDGVSDAVTGCGSSQGVGNPMFTAAIENQVNDYLFNIRRPDFYRGWLENEIVKYSAAYRGITGKQYVPDNRIFDQSSSDWSVVRRQIIPTKVGQSREMLAFYLKSIRAILKLYPGAAYIISTQPMVNQFAGDFVDIYQSPPGTEAHRLAVARRERELEAYLTAHEDEPCGQSTLQPSFAYVFANGAIQLERLADEMRGQGRRVEYANMGTLFPDPATERIPYFIDPAHLSDAGTDILGRFYADRILAADATNH